jgi:nucleoside-diphosphate-sugar epimerase
VRAKCRDAFVGDICDAGLIERINAQFEISEIFHLAALLSTRGEFAPETAHHVNVGGTLNLLKLAAEQAGSHGQSVKFLFPSSIAAYGMPTIDAKRANRVVGEDQFTHAHTMYGVNKLAGEELGRYYQDHYRKLAKDRMSRPVDFRSIRFPGIISSDTVPSGGTSDYGPEMIHAVAQGKAYDCFVRPDTRIPFMTMPEAIDALLRLAAAPKDRLTRIVYNVSAFSPTAADFERMVKAAFPGARVPGDRRQLAGGVRRLGRPARLGLEPDLHLRGRVREVPDAQDPGPVRQGLSARRARFPGQESAVSCGTLRG